MPRMSKVSERFDFGGKTLPEVRVLFEIGRERLDGGRFARFVVDPFIDRAHPSASEESYQSIRAEVFRLHRFSVKRNRVRGSCPVRGSALPAIVDPLCRLNQTTSVILIETEAD